MRDLFAVPWLTRSRRTLLSIGAVLILVFSVALQWLPPSGEEM